MSKITVDLLKKMRGDIEAAMKTVEAAHGVKLSLGRCTYCEDTATFKLEVARVGDGGEAITKDAADFKLYAPMLGIAADMLFKTVRLLGTNYKIVGLKPRRAKPVLAISERDGRTYCFTADAIKSAHFVS